MSEAPTSFSASGPTGRQGFVQVSGTSGYTSCQGERHWRRTRKAEGGRRIDAGAGPVATGSPAALCTRLEGPGVLLRTAARAQRSPSAKGTTPKSRNQGQSMHSSSYLTRFGALQAEAAPICCLRPIVDSEVLARLYWARRYNRGPDISL